MGMWARPKSHTVVSCRREVVGLYLNPPDRAWILCVDEKSQIQAWDRTPLRLPLRPGQAQHRTHDDVRHGTTSLGSGGVFPYS